MIRVGVMPQPHARDEPPPAAAALLRAAVRTAAALCRRPRLDGTDEGGGELALRLPDGVREAGANRPCAAAAKLDELSLRGILGREGDLHAPVDRTGGAGAACF